MTVKELILRLLELEIPLDGEIHFSEDKMGITTGNPPDTGYVIE